MKSAAKYVSFVFPGAGVCASAVPFLSSSSVRIVEEEFFRKFRTESTV